MLKFSKANAKIEALSKVPELAKYLEGKRKVYSFDLLSGYSCPFAEQCLSKATVQLDGKRKLKTAQKQNSVAFLLLRKYNTMAFTIYAKVILTQSVNTKPLLICARL